jgi:hypothetical protein
MSTRIAHDLGDPVLNIWLMWWNSRQLPFTDAWWNGPFFHPVPGALAFSEHVVGLGLITTPILWLGGSPVLAYNSAFLLSFPLSGAAAYLLCRELTGRDGAAFVGGLAFAFAPYRIAHLSHVDILSWYWMPLALLGLHRYLRTSSPWALALFAAAWLMQVLCKGYALFYFSFVVGLWILWFAPPWREPARVARLVGVWAITGLALLPMFLHYRAVHRQYRLERAPSEIEAFSADASAVLYGSPLLSYWPWFRDGSEMLLFPGLTVIVILALGLGRALRGTSPTAPARSKIRLAIAVLAALTALVALSAVVFGPWRATLGPLKLSVKAVDKPLGLAWAFVILAIVTHARFVDAWRRRSALAFYTSATIACWFFSLGPNPRAFGTLMWNRGPYWWLLQLPGVSSLRVPARFWMVAALCLAVAAALALARLMPPARRGAWAIALAASLGVLWDGWIRALPLPEPPARSAVLESLAAGAEPLLELPMGGDADAAALYRAIFHGRPLINGFSGHEPPHHVALRLGLERRDESVLAALAGRGAFHVRVDRQRDPGGAWERWLAALPGVRSVGEKGPEHVFLVGARAPSDAVTGAPLAVRAVRANVGDELAAKSIDGDVRTCWSSRAPQTGRERVVLDLGDEVALGTLVLSLGPFVRNFPRGLRIELSSDEREWRRISQGGAAGATLLAGLADPGTVRVRFPLGDARARFVRLRQLGSDPTFDWSIAEVEVFAPALRPTARANASVIGEERHTAAPVAAPDR